MKLLDKLFRKKVQVVPESKEELKFQRFYGVESIGLNIIRGNYNEIKIYRG